MIAACFLPHPLLLLGEYASAADPGADLRAHCRDQLTLLAGLRPDGLVVIAGSPRTTDSRPAVGLRVARELLAGLALPQPTEVTVPFDATQAEIHAASQQLRAATQGRVAVLVLGDGSARRGQKAPGHFDERASAVDDTIAAALAAGDPQPLTDLEPILADELLIAGRAAWQVLAGAVPGPPVEATATMSDPFGVAYHVALWQWGRGSDE